MSNRKGSEWELDLLKYFRYNDADYERLHLTGKEDEGDGVLKVGEPLVIQAKNEKGHNLAHLKDAKIQAEWYARHRGLDFIPDWFLIMKRRNHRVSQAYVVQELDQWLRREMT